MKYEYLADKIVPNLARRSLKPFAIEIEKQLANPLPDWTKLKQMMKESIDIMCEGSSSSSALLALQDWFARFGHWKGNNVPDDPDHRFLANEILPKLAKTKYLKEVAAEIEKQLAEASPNWTKAMVLLKKFSVNDFLANQAYWELAAISEREQHEREDQEGIPVSS